MKYIPSTNAPQRQGRLGYLHIGGRKYRQLYRMVGYSREHGGFVYQITEDGPLFGPFTTRESAIADAKWNLGDKK